MSDKKDKSLIIVESPAKIKTLQKFLGSNYLFESSIGHIRDLPVNKFGIDIEHDFEPEYETMPDKQAVIAKLKKAAKISKTVYLSSDPDREGEAIAWHIAQILPPGTDIKRVSFNSITKDAVIKALKEPREIDMAQVNAQQARRLLDRIVGYKISPILNRRIHRGKDGYVSAGRVQSVALKLVVDREREIEAFKPVEYWNLGAIFKNQEEERSFRANLFSVEGKRIEKEAVPGKEVTLIGSKGAADLILERMKKGPYIVANVEKKEKKRNPVPPFITSTLQQEASRHHGFSSARTMGIAQKLYEGIDLGNEGTEGLITYMRTDSVRIVPEALDEARKYILETYGADYLPSQAKIYNTQKAAQDAHEAIRPTNLMHTPEKLEPLLPKEQFQLYQLIWRRFISSQMTPAIYDTVSADISADDGIILRATGSVMKFAGYLAVYEEKIDDEEKDEESRTLPNLVEGQKLTLLELMSEQAFTRPPPRFTEASLVKELEKSGIGRPSTYATIMNKIQSRDYTTKESGRLKPTELGFIIAVMLENNFQLIMNIGFTAEMEDALEQIADNQKDWKILIRDFWKQFEPTLEIAEKEAFVPKVLTDLDCPLCGNKLQKIWSKSKYFYGCSTYPECTYTAPLEELNFNREDYAENFDWDQKCPKCQSEMKIRHGRFGTFLGCVRYPECKGIVNIPKKGETAISQEEMPPCPAIGCTGQITARKSRYGKTFYSCSTFPECDVIANSLDQLAVKYVDHPRTAYVKKESKWGKGKGKGKAEAATDDKKGDKAAKTKTKAEKTKKTAKKPSTAKKTTTKKTGAPAGGGFGKEQSLSPELSSIVGAPTMARTEVTKKMWDYIKEKNLQDPANKRMIIPDEKLEKVFGSKEPVSMFQMAKLLNKHFS